MNFMLPVPEASVPAVDICSDKSAAGMIFSASDTLEIKHKIHWYDHKYRKGVEKCERLQKKLCDEMFCFSLLNMKCSLLFVFWVPLLMKHVG